jgi:hypothetical protein
MTADDQKDEIEDSPTSGRRLKASVRAGRRTNATARRVRTIRASAGRPGGLIEWHAMTADERRAAWKDLCAWVTWLHDRYELGIEERLPPCWAEHPGLIEELWALKAWREEIYRATPPGSGTAETRGANATGQAARYWHAELRQTITAATTFYAAGCRAQHQGATTRAATDTDLQQRWAAANPDAGIPAGLLTTAVSEGREDSYLFLTAATMGNHRLVGKVTNLGQTMSDFVFYDNSWWTQHRDGWLRITDPTTSADLSKRAAALALADASVQRHKAPASPAAAADPARPQ